MEVNESRKEEIQRELVAVLSDEEERGLCLENIIASQVKNPKDITKIIS